MKSSPILPLVAFCALSLQSSQAQSSVSSSYWDHIVGGRNGGVGTWYVPPLQMTAYVVARDSSVNTRIRFGNYYQFTCTNGTFNGPTTVSMEKLTPAGWIPLYSPSNSIMSGTISPPPAGVINMTIITPPQGAITSPLTNYAKGHMIFVAGEWRMTMQTTLPSNPLNSASPPYILQWANMTKLAPRQQLPSLGQAKDDVALRSRSYAWLQDTEWSVQNSALFDGAAQSFRINTYTAGYFFGSSTGPDPFWVSGTVAPDGSLYIVFSAAADGLPDGIYLAQVGSIGRSAGRNWSMVFASYPPGPNGPEYFGYATLVGSRLTPKISYNKILLNNESVTGVRGYDSKRVVLTGSYLNKGKVQGLWWLGSLDTRRGTYYKVAPKFPGQTVNSSLFYGPNTALFDPSLGAGNVRIVGSYQYAQSAPNALNHGAVFTGSLDGRKGNWTQIDVPTTSLTNVGVSVCNTIPHSTMGDLVVGNYDLTTNPSQPIPDAGTGNAFIYHITSRTWTILAPTNAGTAPSGTTAYGIWQNGTNSNSYTVAGGADNNGTNTAFLVDYNADTRTFTNLTYFADTNTPGFTHFEGITGRDGGYNLIATTANGPAFVSVDRTPSGFSAAKWTPLNYPGSTMTTGNTVYQNYGLGIFFGLGGLSLETSYVARIIATTSATPTNMALIPAGSFEMGNAVSASGDGFTDELPVHTVSVSAFYMDKYEVSKALWDEVRAWGLTNGYTDLLVGGGKAPNHPVHSITWLDMVKWSNARSEKEGLTPCYTLDGTVVMRMGTSDPECNFLANGYRLPTEAEWEKAARGGLSGKRFPWGDTITHSEANYFSSSNYGYDVSPTRGFHPSYNDGVTPYSSPVGSFAPNGYGLYDMAGNMWESCWDWYGGSYYASSPSSDPRGPSSGSNHVFRGGAWYNNILAYCTRASNRSNGHPGYDNDHGLGFRCARSSVP